MLEAIRSELGPRFANEQQRAFFDSEAPELLYSGAFGAGKSRILCEKALALGLRYPDARIGIFRKVRASLAATTQLTFTRDCVQPGQVVRSNKTDGWMDLANGSRIWFLGLDPDPATGVPSKVGSLDLDFAFVDEAVEVTEGDWTMLQGRLRHNAAGWQQLAAATNPGDPSHWLKQRFTPSTDERQMLNASTFDNRMLPAAYLERMRGLTGLYRSRYVEGQWLAVSGGIFDPAWLHHRPPPVRIDARTNTWLPDMARIVVAIDPAVTSNADSDETGMVVAGKAVDGNAYVLEDLSCRMAPNGWARRAVEAYHRHKADRIVAEVNNGGDLVKEVIRAVDPGVPYKAVTASRGKQVRHSQIVPFYVDGKVFHVEPFPELESQMLSFGPGSQVSPDRLDALTWAITDLMLKTGWGSGTVESGVA